MIYGICRNTLECSLARLGEVQEFAEGSDLDCKLCGMALIQEFPQARRTGRWKLLGTLLGLTAVLWVVGSAGMWIVGTALEVRGVVSGVSAAVDAAHSVAAAAHTVESAAHSVQQASEIVVMPADHQKPVAPSSGTPSQSNSTDTGTMLQSDKQVSASPTKEEDTQFIRSPSDK